MNQGSEDNELSQLLNQLMTASDMLRKMLAPAADRAISKAGLDVVGNTKAAISSTYVSGDYPVRLPHETTATEGAKLHLALQPAGNRESALEADDDAALMIDRNGNRWIVGKYVAQGQSKTDADLLMGLEIAAPGNVVLESANTEQSTNSATYVKLKEFYDARPGKFRLGFELARTGGTVRAIVRVLAPDGTYKDASAEATLTTTTYPTFTAKTLDTTIDIGLGGSVVAIFLKNDSGPSQTSYVRSAQLKYQRASASLSPYGAVLLD